MRKKRSDENRLLSAERKAAERRAVADALDRAAALRREQQIALEEAEPLEAELARRRCEFEASLRAAAMAAERRTRIEDVDEAVVPVTSETTVDTASLAEPPLREAPAPEAIRARGHVAVAPAADAPLTDEALSIPDPETLPIHAWFAARDRGFDGPSADES